ncbi:MAG: hypothetical protein IJV37_07605 [Bacteroidales bacterium]|nr:hypothetical protein [Bacteroidales bacterium]
MKKYVAIFAALCFAAAATAQETPHWTGPYSLCMPEDHYRISLRSFDSRGRAVRKETLARIDHMIAHNTLFLDEEAASDVHERFDYQSGLGYNGGLGADGHYHLYFGDGNVPLPENEDDGRAWFEEYAPEPASGAVRAFLPELCDFGWDNQADPDGEPGIVLQKMRQFGRAQSFLDRFYTGEEEICGIKCWVFDFRGKGSYGLGDSCWWIDPATGLALKRVGEDGSGFAVEIFDPEYRLWTIDVRPELKPEK